MADGTVYQLTEELQPLKVFVLTKRDQMLLVRFHSETNLEVRNHLFQPSVTGNAAETAEHLDGGTELLRLLVAQVGVEDGEPGVGIAVVAFLPFVGDCHDGSVVGHPVLHVSDVLADLAHTDCRAAQVGKGTVDLVEEVVDEEAVSEVAETAVEYLISQQGVLVGGHRVSLLFSLVLWHGGRFNVLQN